MQIIQYGCVFVEAASVLTKEHNKIKYNWNEKITINLSQENLDILSLFLHNKDDNKITLIDNNKTLMFSKDKDLLNFEFSSCVNRIKGSVYIAASFNLSYMLIKAKQIIYGWV